MTWIYFIDIDFKFWLKILKLIFLFFQFRLDFPLDLMKNLTESSAPTSSMSLASEGNISAYMIYLYEQVFQASNRAPERRPMVVYIDATYNRTNLSSLQMRYIDRGSVELNWDHS